MRGELTLQTTFIGDPGKIKASEEETRAFYLALLTRILGLRRQEIEKQAETDTRREASAVTGKVVTPIEASAFRLRERKRKCPRSQGKNNC